MCARRPTYLKLRGSEPALPCSQGSCRTRRSALPLSQASKTHDLGLAPCRRVLQPHTVSLLSMWTRCGLDIAPAARSQEWDLQTQPMQQYSTPHGMPLRFAGCPGTFLTDPSACCLQIALTCLNQAFHVSCLDRRLQATSRDLDTVATSLDEDNAFLRNMPHPVMPESFASHIARTRWRRNDNHNRMRSSQPPVDPWLSAPCLNQHSPLHRHGMLFATLPCLCGRSATMHL
mmetsp:Transcript_55088/g.101987  ORF Transcript_55088/g.101987 Transcript_55088/m.101987 type:complete len:231 (+) Transcript_55088:119-811(+)